VDFDQRITVDDDVRHLRFLPHVREVNLAYCFLISDEAARHVADAPSVRIVKLYRNDPLVGNNFTLGYDLSKQPVVTDESLRHLARLPRLEELGLWDNDFTDRGVEYLKGARELRKLSLRSTHISRAKLDELGRALPMCTIEAEVALRDVHGELILGKSGHIRPDYVDVGPEHRLPAHREQLVGKTAVVTGTLLGGAPFDWNEYRGKPVMLLYWTTQNGRVDDYLKHVLMRHSTYHCKGLTVVGVNNDSVAYHYLVEKWIRDKSIPWPNLARGTDPPLLNGVEMGGHVCVLIDHTGRIVELMPSTLSGLWEHVDQLLENKALPAKHSAQEPPRTPTDRPSG